MTNKNKLPVIGKRYKYKGGMTEDCFRSFMTSNSEFIFSEHFEELPDQESAIEEDCPNEQAAANWNITYKKLNLSEKWESIEQYIK